eukprot:CAMPEP_0119299520 /NCGR_PEP_ID=MMETSP1333-20130426/1601_1 /TAXON_ID=418940 /ORGANISM="Scyphosphaera apsteinii, Strain RCC1455" /LENGTH=239 /DNA_ID=CAMNT_0007300973 /DNA_START=55 /DNA_END=774 /DNA_ORIENTATION=+
MADAGGASSSRAFDEYPHDKRIIIYPIYINSKATLAEGRRIATKYCVEQPTLPEILDVLQHLGFEAQLEDKLYPRNAFQRGRVRVLLKDPLTGEPHISDITSRKALLQKIGEMIPNLKSRKEGGKAGKSGNAQQQATDTAAMFPGLPPGSLPPNLGMPSTCLAPGKPGMPPGMVPPSMAGMMPPGMAGMMPPGMAGMMPPGMAGMMPPGIAGMMPPGMVAPGGGPSDQKGSNKKKKNRK